jgi:ketosteroid isomerase-like protein
MARISSAAYVTAVLNFLHAYNRGDLDGCQALIDSHAEWHSAGIYHGPEMIREMLEAFRTRFTQPQARPEDFREAVGHVLMVVCFTEGDPEAPRVEERQTWLCDMTDDGLISRVMVYAKPADAARALDAAIALNVHA